MKRIEDKQIADVIRLAEALLLADKNYRIIHVDAEFLVAVLREIQESRERDIDNE